MGRLRQREVERSHRVERIRVVLIEAEIGESRIAESA